MDITLWTVLCELYDIYEMSEDNADTIFKLERVRADMRQVQLDLLCHIGDEEEVAYIKGELDVV